MKFKPLPHILFTFIFSLLSLVFFAQQGIDYPYNGFTDKAEATNKMSNGQKDGKWIEYLDSNYAVVQNKNNAAYYELAVYDFGKVYGKQNYYTQKGVWVGNAISSVRDSRVDDEPDPDISVSAVVDSIGDADMAKAWCLKSGIGGKVLRSGIYLTVKVTNNSADRVIFRWEMCPGIEGLYDVNTDWMGIPSCMICTKNVEYYDTLYPHKPFVVKLMAVATKAPSELIGQQFKVDFGCDCHPNNYERLGHSNSNIYTYWSDAIEIKK